MLKIVIFQLWHIKALCVRASMHFLSIVRKAANYIPVVFVFKSPKECNIQIHVGKVKINDHILPIEKRDMSYPNEILSLRNQVECSQVALCSLFSRVVKDAKKISRVIYRVKSIHYTSLFGFLMMNEKVNEQLTKHQDAFEQVIVVLSWLKRNNHLYQTFLATFEKKQCTVTLGII